MTEELVMSLISNALIVILKVSLPILVTGLIVGLLVGIFQATTQIQEMTLSFIPKIISIFLVIYFLGHWMIQELMEFTKQMFKYIVNLN